MSELPEEPRLLSFSLCPYSDIHIDHLGRGRTLQIHVREVSKLKEKTEVEKEKKINWCCCLCWATVQARLSLN